MYPEDKQKEVPYPMSRKNPFVMPILKWVGGKRQLLDSINPLIPECSTYYEPFIGGGAVLFGRQPNKAVINDSNEELINVYRMIKEEPEELIAALSAHKKQNCEEYYYTVRAWDRDKETYQTRTNVERAARIIYLNKTCYNGLFRVNSSGEFNSPWGRYKNPNITPISPNVSQDCLAIFAVSRIFSSSSTASITLFPNVSSVVRRMPFALTSCSDCASRSAATTFALAFPSAITRTSLGPATKSMPTCP